MSKDDIDKLIQTEKFKISHKKERELLLCLFKLNDVLDDVLVDLNLNRLTDYVYAIAVKFNEFYTDDSCHIIGNEHTNSRLLLIELIKRFFELSFQLLGLDPIQKI
jgi:arginyl-tRNA synthetase